MHTIAHYAVAFVGLLHFYFLVLEMFLWTKPAGLRAFGLTPDRAEASRVLAANQGLYNGVLGAGLIWSSLIRPDFDVMSTTAASFPPYSAGIPPVMTAADFT